MSYQKQNTSPPSQFEQIDTDNAFVRLAKAAVEHKCSVRKAANLEFSLTTDKEVELHDDPIYDAFVTNQSDSADCLKKLTNFTVEQLNTLMDLLSETMSHTIYS